MADELGSPWPEEMIPAPESEAPPEPSTDEPPPSALPEPPRIVGDLFSWEKHEPEETLPDDIDDLFGDEASDDVELFEQSEPLDEPESETVAPPVAEIESSFLPAPPPEPVTVAPDRSHWRSLLGELGLDLPPEPEEPPPMPAAETSVVPLEVVSRSERFGAREAEIVDAELIEEPDAEQQQSPQAVSMPFGAGLFTEDEEQQFVREAPRQEHPPEAETPVELVEAIERDVDDVDKDTDTDDESSPKKRGRRRTRRWKRLHPATEASEESESLAPVAEVEEREVAETFEILDDLFADEEATEQARTVEETDEPATGEEPRKRRRRRRRRSRKGEAATTDRAEFGGEETPDLDDEESEIDDLLEGDEPQEESKELERRRPARRARPPRRPVAEERMELADEDDDEEDSDRPAHRQIPTWEDAVGIVIGLNMEARAKSPGGRRRR